MNDKHFPLHRGFLVGRAFAKEVKASPTAVLRANKKQANHAKNDVGCAGASCTRRPVQRAPPGEPLAPPGTHGWATGHHDAAVVVVDSSWSSRGAFLCDYRCFARPSHTCSAGGEPVSPPGTCFPPVVHVARLCAVSYRGSTAYSKRRLYFVT